MTQLFEPTIDEQIREVERELVQRERVYPKLVADKKLSRDMADRHMDRMRAVLRTLQAVKAATAFAEAQAAEQEKRV